jgi:hypothetical protein
MSGLTSRIETLGVVVSGLDRIGPTFSVVTLDGERRAADYERLKSSPNHGCLRFKKPGPVSRAESRPS